MTRITGIRDGHRVITTVTGPAGALTVDREHHPECPCTTSATAPDFTLQRWNWTTSQWDTHRTFRDDGRGEGNAWDAVNTERALNTGPIRLLHGKRILLADNPDTHYSADTTAGW